MTPKRWLITGVSGGLGLAIAGAALARGDHVAGTLRRENQCQDFEALAPGRVHAILADLSDFAAARGAVQQASLPPLRASGGGRIINIASLAALEGLRGLGLYSASKAAVSLLSEARLPEYAPMRDQMDRAFAASHRN